jgi:hypothetical protein
MQRATCCRLNADDGGIAHGADLGVVPAAEVLQVHDQRIEAREHRRGGHAVGTVQAPHRQAGRRVGAGRDDLLLQVAV